MGTKSGGFAQQGFLLLFSIKRRLWGAGLMNDLPISATLDLEVIDNNKNMIKYILFILILFDFFFS